MKALSLIAALGLAASANVSADYYYGGYNKERSYEITVTNITKGQVFTPVLAAAHNKSIGLFELGEPASEPLAALAEGGATGPLQEVLEGASGQVMGTATSEGLLQAGDSYTFTLTTTAQFSKLSVAAMLLPTNDTFLALNTVKLPHYGTRTYFANAYDAGSETNDELCANIPGPQCGGAPLSPEDSGEGFVHIASGIHGEADLTKSAYDWRGAVAKVKVKRIK